MNRLDSDRLEVRRADQGVTLLIALVYLSLIAIMASTMLASVHRWLDQERRHEIRMQAQAIAEAGLETALFNISEQPDGSYDGEPATAFGEGQFRVIVQQSGGDEFLLIATGELQHQGFPIARRSIDVRADSTGQIIYWGQWSTEEVGHEQTDS